MLNVSGILKIAAALLLASQAFSCASAQKYALMPTIESKLDDTEHEIKPGMAITKQGAVLDIKIEEVQAQKKRLEWALADRDEKLKYLTERNLELETNMKILRAAAGLPIDEPKGTHQGYNADGNLIDYKRPKTLSEEIVGIKHHREPASYSTGVTETDIETNTPTDGE